MEQLQVSDKAVAKEFVFNFPSLLGVGQLNLEPVVDILWMHRAGSTDALPSPQAHIELAGPGDDLLHGGINDKRLGHPQQKRLVTVKMEGDRGRTPKDDGESANMMEASAPQDINAAVILRKRSMDEVNLEPNIKEAKRAWGRPGQQEHHGRQRTIIHLKRPWALEQPEPTLVKKIRTEPTEVSKQVLPAEFVTKGKKEAKKPQEKKHMEKMVMKPQDEHRIHKMTKEGQDFKMANTPHGKYIKAAAAQKQALLSKKRKEIMVKNVQNKKPESDVGAGRHPQLWYHGAGGRGGPKGQGGQTKRTFELWLL
ncbi:hypothetical protein BGZ97_007123 [Linnemannia gamsii]|uniref:Uncharacterized protein n=1 Tax=Linnemannia gamsii TaxID=64522 RepID=A0A9P6QQG5_9FUNG|nr:hypothetical protein BGZ97_007123 [Linnemannia gamsii]